MSADTIRDLLKSLPTGKDRKSKRQRMQKFREIDENGNGICSLAEIDAAVKVKWNIPVPSHAIARAFHGARDISPPVSGFSDDYIDFGEFRIFMVYLQHYYDLFVLFREVDANFDNSVDTKEFMQAIPLLKSWGAAGLEDPNAAWMQMDADGGGAVRFDEFADWALRQGLTDMIEDADDRFDALELLSKQEANLCTKDLEHMKHARMSVIEGVQGQGALTPGLAGAQVLKAALGGGYSSRNLVVTVHRAHDLRIADKTTSDPYAVLAYGGREKQTKCIKRNLNPIWNETIRFTGGGDDLEISLFDKDLMSADDFLGSARISKENLQSGGTARQTLTLTGPKAQGTVEISIKWA